MSATGIPASLKTALDAIADVGRLIIASDFDGCIASIVSRPEDVVPDPTSVAAVRDAAELPNTWSALVSGRARADLEERSGLSAPVILIGSHGSESGDGFTQPVTDADRERLDSVVDELKAIAEPIDGAWVELKPISAVLHVRTAAPDAAAAALEQARAGVATWDGVEATEGKAVLELAVIKTSKGHALDALRERVAADAVIYLGDDVTDEKAFAHLRDSDIGVKVGDGDTIAGYRVADTDDVASVLAYVTQRRRTH